ncbi:MAG: V-type ATP synthase subunit C [Methanoculleus marisnigri]|uniref:V-type ATP synthase subunit C n=1 Tax=Methanoculleus marisnigri TaxID=2198 RepID=A0A124FS36_9EURY|nr:MAG: V-type ATP synthase subunit C [Methanoculleus marisnigri]
MQMSGISLLSRRSLAGISSGLATNYIYACTRMRVRRSRLIPREDYLRMLNMSLPEITRFIGETNYRSEIDELGTSFSGINLVEEALNWNLAKEYQNILELVPGDLKYFTASYLRPPGERTLQGLLRTTHRRRHGRHQGREYIPEVHQARDRYPEHPEPLPPPGRAGPRGRAGTDDPRRLVLGGGTAAALRA